MSKKCQDLAKIGQYLLSSVQQAPFNIFI